MRMWHGLTAILTSFRVASLGTVLITLLEKRLGVMTGTLQGRCSTQDVTVRLTVSVTQACVMRPRANVWVKLLEPAVLIAVNVVLA